MCARRYRPGDGDGPLWARVTALVLSVVIVLGAAYAAGLI